MIKIMSPKNSMYVHLSNREEEYLQYYSFIQNQLRVKKSEQNCQLTTGARFIVLAILCPLVSRRLNCTDLFILLVHLTSCLTMNPYLCYI